MIAILLLALSFPQNPHELQWFRDEHGFIFVYNNGHWYPPAQGKAGGYYAACREHEHIHRRSMDTSQPDVKGGPMPKADGQCHADNVSDRRVQ